MNATSVFTLLIVTFHLTSAQAPLFRDLWVVWNIGQGQWVTHILSDHCEHFDFGGEPGSFKYVRKSLLFYCGNVQNQLFLSHWDYDHFFNLSALAHTLPKLCWVIRPVHGAEKTAARKALEINLPFCTPPHNLFFWQPPVARTSNESSTVFVENSFLIPGDSPSSMEKSWLYQMDLRFIRVLILGHHGSRSSTSSKLLQSLPQLEMAISSARYLKYHHPHKETLERLNAYFVPVLRTEQWGNIWWRDY